MTSPQPARSGDYVLGTDPSELERLGLQHRLWSDLAHQSWRRAGIGPGLNVLDVGCGPGFATFDLAQLVARGADPARRTERLPDGRVVGIDESARYLEHVRAQCSARGLTNVQAVCTDVTRLAGATGPELRAGSFDLAYARWVFCFVSRPEDVVAGVRSLLCPGGRFVVHDYFNYEAMTTAPRSAAFLKAVRATGASWRARGGDPDIVGRLPAIMRSHGMRIEHLDVHQRLARPGDSMWHWPQTFWRNFLPILVANGHLTEQDRAEWERDWEQLSANPAAFALLPPVFELIAVRES